MKHEKSCGAIVIKDKKVLIIRQNSQGYGFPKGHVEKGETEIETAIREVKEETNVDIIVDEKLRFSMSYITDKNIDKEVVLFVGYPINNIETKAQAEEISEVEWINIDDVNDKLTFDSAKELWKKVLLEVKKD